VLWGNRQQRNRKLHGSDSCPVDIQPVDIVNGQNAYADSRRLCANNRSELPPRLFVERFGIVDTVDFGIRRKDNRSRHNGTGKRPHPHFINPCNVNNAGFPEDALKVEHRIHSFAFACLVVKPPGKRFVQLPGAGTGIPLQPSKNLR
jgi:hypothetical protein